MASDLVFLALSWAEIQLPMMKRRTYGGRWGEEGMAEWYVVVGEAKGRRSSG